MVDRTTSAGSMSNNDLSCSIQQQRDTQKFINTITDCIIVIITSFLNNISNKESSLFSSASQQQQVQLERISKIIYNILYTIYTNKYWILLCIVIINLVNTANDNHIWYEQQFGTTYRLLNRKRIIPGIF